jgi:hypothetical protein
MKRYRLCAALAALGLSAVVDATVLSGVSVAAAPVGVASAPAASTSGSAAVKAPAAPAGAFINRPTIPLAQYNALKAASPALPDKSATVPNLPSSPTQGLTVKAASGFNGITQATAGFVPSDSNGVIGGSNIAEIVNSNLVTYSTTGVLKTNRTLNSLANYATESIFDPRIIYDANWKRFVISAEAFPEPSGTTQFQFVMVSKTANPGGAYFVYRSNTLGWCGGTNPDWDYPQLGQTQDAIVITGNCFNSAGEQPDTFGIAKAAIYNGQGWSVPVFGRPGEGTLTPANVYDNRPTDFLISTNQHMVGFQDPQAGGYASITSDNAIAGFETFAVPRSAGQAGCTTTSCHLDTSDGRFVNDSSQFGDQLWNVATYGFAGVAGSFATPYWGQFSIAGHNTTQFGPAVTDACSDDFNASLVTSTAGKMWLNYTSTDPQGSACGQTFVRQMEAGRTAATGNGLLDPKINPFTSPAELTGDFDPNFGLQRWGDSSSVSLMNATTAWSVNNSVADASDWGTRWEKMTQ